MDKFTREEIRKEMARQDAYARTVTIRVVGEKAEHVGELFQQEELEFYLDGNPVNLKWISTKQCSRGHLLGPDTPPVGLCQVSSCKAVVCSREGCSHLCRKCGKTLCAAHAHVFKDGEVACPRCRIQGWFRRVFW